MNGTAANKEDLFCCSAMASYDRRSMRRSLSVCCRRTPHIHARQGRGREFAKTASVAVEWAKCLSGLWDQTESVVLRLASSVPGQCSPSRPHSPQAAVCAFPASHKLLCMPSNLLARPWSLCQLLPNLSLLALPACCSPELLLLSAPASTGREKVLKEVDECLMWVKQCWVKSR